MMYVMTPMDHISHDKSYFSGPNTSGAKRGRTKREREAGERERGGKEREWR